MQAAQTVQKAEVSQDELASPSLIKKEMVLSKQILLCNTTGLFNENGAKSFLLRKPRVSWVLSNNSLWII